ncbi:MAG: hypothetical protein U5K81_09875 [Trueperaceae bacterium]|nr:hypothetical protein [Trueperaceae bacterium]
MKQLKIVMAIAFAGVLAACAPGTITPEELVVTRPYDEAFALVTNTIATQPYPDDTTGWVVTQSDQVGGFVTAELEGRACAFLGLGCEPYTARVSVALNTRGEELTAVQISQTGHSVAQDLADRLADRLRAP